ncbi:hypothetical protein [Granulicoccus phenolivorans]|uniref:hypothetical protein n=1 Tax=Granulicoccus phenolivorans TaxID=266854 RepID=UPI00047B6335|nr:hypothetical protein [Granulicoccus phenolivorans]
MHVQVIGEWRQRRDSHQQRVDTLLVGHRERTDRGIKDPVEDFLWEYYTYRPYQLRRWHPGHTGVLPDAEEYAEVRDYIRTDHGYRVDTAAVVAQRSRTIARLTALLRATADRAPAYGCFGMHEWAMVYRLRPERTRHPQLPLRFDPERLARILEERPVVCSHFDAYRFFTREAKPLNAYAPTRDTQLALDQPGCLHVNMDLYRAAYKLSPLIESELVVDCFELARDIRRLDMAASAYDLTERGIEPVRVETAAGRAAYAAAQREFAERARPLRTRLLAHLDVLSELAAAVG